MKNMVHLFSNILKKRDTEKKPHHVDKHRTRRTQIEQNSTKTRAFHLLDKYVGQHSSEFTSVYSGGGLLKVTKGSNTFIMTE